MASVDVTPYERRGPIPVYGPKVGKKRPIVDRQDGYGAFFKVSGTRKPYTIYQTINRVTQWTTAEEGTKSDRASFTEAWKSPGSGDVLDKFVLSRYFRQSDTGFMNVVAHAWVVPGRRDLEAEGFAPSEDGTEPWGRAMGRHGHLQPLPGTRVLRRWFRVSWTDEYVIRKTN